MKRASQIVLAAIIFVSMICACLPHQDLNNALWDKNFIQQNELSPLPETPSPDPSPTIDAIMSGGTTASKIIANVGNNEGSFKGYDVPNFDIALDASGSMGEENISIAENLTSFILRSLNQLKSKGGITNQPFVSFAYISDNKYDNIFDTQYKLGELAVNPIITGVKNANRDDFNDQSGLFDKFISNEPNSREALIFITDGTVNVDGENITDNTIKEMENIYTVLRGIGRNKEIHIFIVNSELRNIMRAYWFGLSTIFKNVHVYIYESDIESQVSIMKSFFTTMLGSEPATAEQTSAGGWTIAFRKGGTFHAEMSNFPATLMKKDISPILEPYDPKEIIDTPDFNSVEEAPRCGELISNIDPSKISLKESTFSDEFSDSIYFFWWCGEKFDLIINVDPINSICNGKNTNDGGIKITGNIEATPELSQDEIRSCFDGKGKLDVNLLINGISFSSVNVDGNGNFEFILTDSEIAEKLRSVIYKDGNVFAEFDLYYDKTKPVAHQIAPISIVTFPVIEKSTTPQVSELVIPTGEENGYEVSIPMDNLEENSRDNALPGSNIPLLTFKGNGSSGCKLSDDYFFDTNYAEFGVKPEIGKNDLGFIIFPELVKDIQNCTNFTISWSEAYWTEIKKMCPSIYVKPVNITGKLIWGNKGQGTLDVILEGE